MLTCDALFISDLHLGSNQCEAGHLAAFLECIRPRQLFLVGDIIDLQAIRFNANVDADFLTDLIDALLAREDEDPLTSETWQKAQLLRTSHRRVLERFQALHRDGVAITYIPGNHDAYLRRHAGLERPGFTIRRQDVYCTPSGKRLLVRHGDEYDRLIRFHAGAAEGLARLQEHYSAGINGLLFPFTRPANGPLPAGWNAEGILQSAVDLLASHQEWPIPISRGLNSSGGFSLAFVLESALKSRTGHDRLIKRRIVQHLQREGRGPQALDGLINGHTHIPEATPLGLPGPVSEGDGPCHITYYNTGSWARSQRRLGRTALVVAHNGTVGMVRFDRRQGIEPFQPPRFPFNTYPMRPCPGCGLGVASLGAAFRD
ncbi:MULTISPECIES: UDP-2,3-diacylglucosamine diphosphatase [unclassified Cyanobium]|uniref:UDP-2,3-diacylglucosamine diphosphatase n=1 Tax=unclassified Cyanobium TaxID=2627006 RepID=UPI0020CFD879|nr:MULTISPECIES: UDP-2,3-diacylglucosamine diphosphatase [unclassified Cyanobium]MCP9835304.1 UDP-2,3-diacylglucosamine diphosphatase [Cyanobium sp. La Preciosa 7G6]MCP9938070.1 UDP-2,3-diacylglucosamine diphosphatase [Cyanobium sp. Aljojuca 7A6]